MQRLVHLYDEYRNGTIDETDKQELFQLIGQADEETLKQLADNFLGRQTREDLSNLDAHTEHLLIGINRHIADQERTVRTRRLWKYFSAAAAMVLALSFLGYFFLDIGQKTLDNRLAASEILPGAHRALLTLADGQVVELSEAHSGLIIGDSSVSYQDGSPLELSHISHLMSITTPKGGTYSITLPDGTKVWLNAESSLKYPSRFDSLARIVELTGEAYFEVRPQATDNRQHPRISVGSNVSSPASHLPFLVKTANQTVEVLGTQFNISAYADEIETKTTLVEGSVRLRAGAIGASVSLIPGEQGRLTNGVIDVQQVDTAPFTAWKNGDFEFTGQTIRQIMPQLARWYDIEVVYEGDISEETYFGKIDRNKPLSEVLMLLQGTDDIISFKLEGRRITVMK